MDTDINKRCQRYLLFCWWEQWHSVLLGTYLNFCSKVVTTNRRECWRFYSSYRCKTCSLWTYFL